MQMQIHNIYKVDVKRVYLPIKQKTATTTSPQDNLARMLVSSTLSSKNIEPSK